MSLDDSNTEPSLNVGRYYTYGVTIQMLMKVYTCT